MLFFFNDDDNSNLHKHLRSAYDSCSKKRKRKKQKDQKFGVPETKFNLESLESRFYYATSTLDVRLKLKRKRATWCYVDVCARRLPPCAPCADRASFPTVAVPRARGCSPYFRLRDYFRYDLPPSHPVCSWGRPIAKVERAKPHRLSELIDISFVYVYIFFLFFFFLLFCFLIFFFFLIDCRLDDHSIAKPNSYYCTVYTGTYRLFFVLLRFTFFFFYHSCVLSSQKERRSLRLRQSTSL